MGIDFYIGTSQIKLTNAYWYNEFLNWVSVEGEYPHILNHSPIHGSYTLDEGETAADLYAGSVIRLKQEVEDLLSHTPPDFCKYVLTQMLKGCNIATNKRVKITMDNGHWEGDE